MEIATISNHKDRCVSRDIFRWSRACLEVRGQNFGLIYGIMSEKLIIKRDSKLLPHKSLCNSCFNHGHKRYTANNEWTCSVTQMDYKIITFCSIWSYSAIIFTRTCVSEKSRSMQASSAHNTLMARPGPGNGCRITRSGGRPRSLPNIRTWTHYMVVKHKQC